MPAPSFPTDAPLEENAARRRIPALALRPLSAIRQRMGRAIPDSVWHNWRWDLAAGISAGIYQGCIWTFALQLARGQLHATGYEISLATAAPAIGYLFATLWARQMEGRSKMPFVVLTWLISRGLFLLTPFVVRGGASREMFVGLICVTPIIFSVSTPAYTAIMKDIYPDELRGRLMSYVRVGMAGGMLLTARIMGIWQEHGGLDFRWMFAIGGVFGVGTAFAFSRLRLTPVDRAVSMPPLGLFLRQTFGILKHNKGYRWFIISVFIAGFGNLVANTYYPIYQVDHFHIRPTQIATMQNLTNLLSLGFLFFWGWYMDRYGSLAAVLLACGTLCFVPLLYAIGPSIGWLYAASAIGGIASPGIDLGYLNTTLMFAETGRAAQYQAVHSSFFGLRGTIAPLVAVRLLLTISHVPTLRTAHWSQGFLTCMGIMLIGTLCQFLSLRTYRRAARQ